MNKSEDILNGDYHGIDEFMENVFCGVVLTFAGAFAFAAIVFALKFSYVVAFTDRII